MESYRKALNLAQVCCREGQLLIFPSLLVAHSSLSVHLSIISALNSHSSAFNPPASAKGRVQCL